MDASFGDKIRINVKVLQNTVVTIGFNKQWSNTKKEGMFGAIFDDRINKFKDGGIVDVPYPFNSYLVISYENTGYIITSYSIDIQFIKKYNKLWYDDGEINVEDSKKAEERTQEVIVVNGEEIVYESIENENTATLIFVISLATFVMVMFISCILAAIYR